MVRDTFQSENWAINGVVEIEKKTNSSAMIFMGECSGLVEYLKDCFIIPFFLKTYNCVQECMDIFFLPFYPRIRNLFDQV